MSKLDQTGFEKFEESEKGDSTSDFLKSGKPQDP